VPAERCQQSGASRPTRRCADATDPIEPALRLLADVDAPVLFRGILFRDCRIGANDGARAVSGDGEVANDAAVAGDEVDGAVSVLAWSGRRQVRWVASAASYGVINKMRANSPALSLPAFTTFFCSRARARRHRAVPAERCQQSGASRPTRRCADATDPIEPALRLLADVDAPD
jgi:hypothetical protein